LLNSKVKQETISRNTFHETYRHHILLEYRVKRGIYVFGHNEGDFRICGRFVHLAA